MVGSRNTERPAGGLFAATFGDDSSQLSTYLYEPAVQGAFPCSRSFTRQCDLSARDVSLKVAYLVEFE